ncbi:MAG TPA: methionyl-tRNA formyltransferase [Burkholderiaceae bacterium]|nr:methionyl-tRNA formyltransferase [Burkholderiaceae bacterium]HSB98654.1 methionyl-tRNA formyltransferase [Burkholderiaceae bacterium]
MRLAFAGTPAFAATALQALVAAGHDVMLVLTQPDRPSGRGLKLHPSAVKALALQLGLPVMQPGGLRLDGRFAADAQAVRRTLQDASPEAIVVAAYGLILPPWLLELPRRGCLNIHASLLPRWRGAAPIQRAIEAGDLQTGISIMQMDAGLDTGGVLLTRVTAIEPSDTSASLHDRLAVLGAQAIVESVKRLAHGGLEAVPQPTTGVTYAHKIGKDEAALDWRASADLLERRVRAFDPFPGAVLNDRGHMLKLWRAAVRPGGHGAPGEVVSTLPGPLVVACGRGALELLELQRPGGRRLAAALCFPAGAPELGQRLSPAVD